MFEAHTFSPLEVKTSRLRRLHQDSLTERSAVKLKYGKTAFHSYGA